MIKKSKMTVQEYLKQFSFNDILPPTRKMIVEWRKNEFIFLDG